MHGTTHVMALAADSPPTAEKILEDGRGEQITVWLISVLPDSAAELQIWLVSGAVILGALLGIGSRRLEAKGKKQRVGFDGAADAVGEGIAVVLGGLPGTAWRFIVGEPLWGRPKTDSAFLRPGTILDRSPINELGSAAEAAPADKTDPHTRRSPRAALLDRAGSKDGPDLLTWTWHRWPGAVRSGIRLGVVAVIAGVWLGPVWTVGVVAAVQLLVLIVVMACRGGRARTDAQIYGPGLWAALVQLLRLSDEDQQRGESYWLQLSDDLSSETSRIVIRLPLRWLGSEKEKASLAHALHSRLPGEWGASYDQHGHDPFVEFTPKPPPEPEPELPTLVEWIPSADPARVHVGETFRGPRYVDTDTETPHWGISGGTGDGKTTVLIVPVVHGRQHGSLIDAITMKAAAFRDVEGESGIRVHKTGRQAVAALAEFYISMKAAEAVQGTPEGDQLPGRILVIDEFASFVKSAKIWWKYGLQARGMPPFEAWFHMVLMQGRSSNHKIVIGAHTFTRELFGDTETRDLVGTKGIVGPASTPKWTVTYGVDMPRTDYHHEIKGRGVIGVTGSQDIEEIQYAYITPYARDYLRQCPPAPSWHTDGQMAPWITAASLKEAEEELAIAEFLPGGVFMRGVTLVTNRPIPPSASLPPRSEHVTSHGAEADVTGDVTTDHDAEQVDVSEEAQLPVFSLKEACEAGILPVSYDAARKRVQRARQASIDLPEGVTLEGTTFYTAKELLQWWTLVTAIRRPSTTPSM
ncbi:type IV secretory system conjugative DNA transfer family protein (plasmid) [Streptomyces scopuliridis]|uniref:type IV secretory system conjugative DNA transfer family protein n=1 Tax=Streptomyces scopuliridis TaxID=452529 RepID=UPI002DD95A2A|nr:type IV secretory system conjugative DNA transfer family protein [Streptomyces scopuliridis]WSB39018.1 type IV secretory system conjugative DNA transfer family protein [Streptomyces scopuliridis]